MALINKAHENPSPRERDKEFTTKYSKHIQKIPSLIHDWVIFIINQILMSALF